MHIIGATFVLPPKSLANNVINIGTPNPIK